MNEKKEPEPVLQRLITIGDQEIVESKPAPIISAREAPKIIMNFPKPKTASAVHHKAQKSLKIKKKEKAEPIRLDSIKRVDSKVPSEDPQTPVKVESMKWETQEKLCKELSDMYETELQRIYEIKGKL